MDARSMLDIALDALAHGFAVVPPKEDGSKRPDGEWKHYQQRLPTETEVRGWYEHNQRAGIGIVCGSVSGNLEMLEFEGRAMDADIHDEYATLAGQAGLADLVDRIFFGYCEFTPTGGLHLLYRVEGPVAGNTKLARRPATPDELDADPNDRIKVLIETRGEGGYVIIAPSHGPVHPTTGEWLLTHGGFDTVATITPQERNELHRLARILDQHPDPVPIIGAPSRNSSGTSTGDRPGDIYNQQADIAVETARLLERHGWTPVFSRSHGDHNDVHLRRPGKHVGTSAVLHMDAGTLVVFSTSTPFEAEQAYTPFAVYTVLEHAGDYQQAARTLKPSGSSNIIDLSELLILPPEPAAAGDDTEEPTGPQPIDWQSFWHREHVGEDWLIEPVVPRGRQVALWAKHKTGKSLLALEIAAAAATGTPCLSQAASEPIHVMYVDLEMTEDDLHDRLLEMGYGPSTNLDHLHYYLLPALPPLDSRDGGVTVVKLAVQHQAELVVIDTMARAVSGDENDADTYRSFYRYTGMHLKARGIAMMRLDHGGKDPTKGQRGSSSKGDDVDIVWQLTLNDDGLTLKRDAARMSWVPERVALRRSEDPLRHELVEGLWPAGTRDAANAMDRLGIDPELSQTAAIRAFRESGHTGKTDVLRAAWKYRRRSSTAPFIGEIQ